MDKNTIVIHKLQQKFHIDCIDFGWFLDEGDERKVLVKRLALCVADRPDLELDLTGDLNELKKQVCVRKLEDLNTSNFVLVIDKHVVFFVDLI